MPRSDSDRYYPEIRVYISDDDSHLSRALLPPGKRKLRLQFEFQLMDPCFECRLAALLAGAKAALRDIFGDVDTDMAPDWPADRFRLVYETIVVLERSWASFPTGYLVFTRVVDAADEAAFEAAQKDTWLALAPEGRGVAAFVKLAVDKMRGLPQSQNDPVCALVRADGVRATSSFGIGVGGRASFTVVARLTRAKRKRVEAELELCASRLR